jgi:hypothetical protein
MGQPYDFQFPPTLHDAIDVTLGPGAPEAETLSLNPKILSIGVGKPTYV